MRRNRRAASFGIIALVVAVFVAGAPSAGAGARRQATKDKPTETEIGVTATTIRIAVIADVDTPLAPGVFRASKEGVEAWGKYINAHGGLAGRKVQVDFIDSKLSPDETRNAIIKACQEDFAMVGTTALFLNNVDDMVACKDKTGKATGLPDVPELITDPTHIRSPVSYPVIVPGLDVSDPTNTTYKVATGQFQWFIKHIDKSLHGTFITAADIKSTQIAGLVGIAGAGAAGIKKDNQFDGHSADAQDKYLPYVQAIKSSGSTYVTYNSNEVTMANLLKEARIQGVTGVKVWDCTIACYSQRFIDLAGQAGEGQYVEAAFVPFEEAKYNKSVKAYIKSVGGIDKAAAFGAQAWIAALFFRDAVKQAVATNGVNGLTRANFLTAAKSIHKFTADGMTGPNDVGGKVFSGCFALLQVKGGKFVRVYPKKPATFDCKTSNIKTVHINIG